MRDVILLPTYNERENIAPLISEIFAGNPDVFVLVIDDNSPDNTAEEVRRLQTKYPHLHLLLRDRKEGLGVAYIHAFRVILQMQGIGAIIMMDADFSHHPNYISLMRRELDRNDAVLGSRYIHGGGTTGWGLHRRLLSRWGNRYFSAILRQHISDYTGGFNAIRISVLQRINLDTLSRFRGYAFMTALKYYMRKSGARIKEIPIVFKNRTKGKSKMSRSIIHESIITPWILLYQTDRVRLLTYIFLFLLVFLGFLVRCGALFFGLPYANVFGDEIAHVIASLYLFEHKTIIANFPFYYLPPLMAYFTLPIIAIWGVFGILFGYFDGVAEFREFAILYREYFLAAPRFVSAVISTLAIPVIFLFAKKLFNTRVAWFASIFLTFDFLFVHESQIGHIWGPIVFFVLSALYACYMLFETGEARWYRYAALLIGFGYGLGQVPIVLVAIFVTAHWMRVRTLQHASFTNVFLDKTFWKNISILAILLVLFTVLNPVTFYKHVNDLMQGLDVTLGTQFGKVLDSHFSIAPDTSEFSLRRNWSVIGSILFNSNPFLLFLGIMGMIWFACVSLKKENIFKKLLVAGFPLFYLFLFSFLFYKFTVRYVLPATPFLLIAAAYFLDRVIASKQALLRIFGWVLFSISFAYSLVLVGRYLYLLQKPYTVADATEWMYHNVPSGSRVVSDRFLWPDKESIDFQKTYSYIDWLDSRKTLLQKLPQDRYPQPNYFVIDINFIDLSMLSKKEKQADLIFISFNYQPEMEEKRALLKTFPTAQLVYSRYPKGSMGPVRNFLNLDPDFVKELFYIHQLGPSVEIYKIK